MTIFGALESGRSALKAQFKGMEVSGQNVANANTPGYSRQRVELSPAVPAPVAGMSYNPGYGVQITAITRLRSEFYHTQTLNSGSYRSYWQMRFEAFQGAEVIFMEPGENGLSGYLGDFFDSWQELSGSPESAAVRMSLREQAVSFTRAVQDTYLRLTDLRLDLQHELEKRVVEINQLAAEAAALNDQIIFAGALGESSNALMDQLDLVLEQLSGLIDIRVYRKDNGAVELFAGGRLLVQDQHFYPLSLQAEGGRLTLVSSREIPLELRSGRVKGLLEAVNDAIPGLQGELDEIIYGLVEEVNRLHVSAYGLDGSANQDFFAAIDDQHSVPASLQFKLSEAVLDDIAVIAAASRSGEPGNGETALFIARLRDQVGERGIPLMDSYRGIISALGVEGRESGRMAEAFGKAESQLREQHLSVTGVNLDEEMLNMIQYQHAWQAAANFISQVDRMLEILFMQLSR
ncbi:MAG TPA: flagellar hook-associated protein FlgK [Firmicutes bacterium]|nr:flagellar hook-associated protein FlgK [Bacillota bacterium]